MAKQPSGFGAEFKRQRKLLGAGKTFTYNGKSYSTNQAGEGGGAPAKSVRPMAKPATRPAAGTPINASQPRRAAGTPTPPPPAAKLSALAPGKSVRPQGRPPTSTNAPGTSIKPAARPANAFLNSVSNPGAGVSKTVAAGTKVKMDAVKKPGQDRAAAAMEAGRKRAEAMRTKK